MPNSTPPLRALAKHAEQTRYMSGYRVCEFRVLGFRVWRSISRIHVLGLPHGPFSTSFHRFLIHSQRIDPISTNSFYEPLNSSSIWGEGGLGVRQTEILRSSFRLRGFLGDPPPLGSPNRIILMLPQIFRSASRPFFATNRLIPHIATFGSASRPFFDTFER